jgi:APA family basic amino acid/polyamine antiporter
MAATDEGRRTSSKALGFWMSTALVVGNMIGSGVYLLPAALAPFGWNAVIGWVLTILGALAIAFVFARLARALPQAGGPYAYTQAAFGPGMGFAVAWTYWLSIVIGNAAVAVGSVSYLSVLVPAIGRIHMLPPLLTLATIWALTLVNCLGARSVGGLQVVATIVKLVPLAAVLIVAIIAIAGGARSALPFHATDIHAGGITAAATLTLWALLGLESATVPADKVIDAARTVPRATLFGTGFAGLIYLAVCTGILLLMPAAGLSRSAAPFTDFLDRFVGFHAGAVLAAFAALSGFGALNGWLLLQGELPSAMARGGVFPQWLAEVSANGTPVRAHLVSTVILTVILLMNYQRSMVDLFTFLVLVATTATLFAYLFAALSALRLQRRGQLDASRVLTAIAILALGYSLWAIWGAGSQPALLGLAFMVSALPIYWLMQRVSRPSPVPRAENPAQK